ncbi:hypothetical protein TNIN_485401 [Trichonephila inaurata madagascariensis]|uniref:Uncharacterized protein n=1 Tax=Trichonephila inaurata madagascariensis TaxID=2747483 RepID=A0A8X6ML97_9ARAC|nr:hypothetical protein TNIN_485401 [Trichonephila inaurata madagascariensis]
MRNGEISKSHFNKGKQAHTTYVPEIVTREAGSRPSGGEVQVQGDRSRARGEHLKAKPYNQSEIRQIQTSGPTAGTAAEERTIQPSKSKTTLKTAISLGSEWKSRGLTSLEVLIGI